MEWVRDWLGSFGLSEEQLSWSPLHGSVIIVVSPMKLGGRQIAELIKQQAGTLSVVPGATV